MRKKGVVSTEGFEPPNYLASLIGAVNDGAKAAQGGALAFLLVGIYLLATAFSASDEDLLLGKTVTISQIGASLPVSFSFAIAPLVFVFLHVYTLVRYDMLAANVRQFLCELRDSVPLESDRERCRQLLANVEFVAALTTPRGSTQYSRFWPSLFFGIVALFPVAVLLLVQINALRYQSEMIVWVQRAWLALDLAVLAWFFARNPFYDDKAKDVPVRRRAVHLRLVVGLPALVLLLNFAWLGTAPPEADSDLVRYDPRSAHWKFPFSKPSFADVVRQPLDMLACPGLNWGCRFLRVDHRTLIGKVWDDKAVAELRTGAPERAKMLPNLEGVELRGRSLRFIVLDESRLYAADITGADLRNASLTDADLSGARLSGALLRGSNITGNQLSSVSLDLSSVDLSGIQFRMIDLRGRSLRDANLNDTFFAFAQLAGANLVGAHLRSANLGHAHLESADLRRADLKQAKLQSANLQDAFLKEADLSGAMMTDVLAQAADFTLATLKGAKLDKAQLQGATLIGANLENADLSFANLRAADLRGANLQDAHSEGATDFALADLRNAHGSVAITFAANAEEPVLVSDKSTPVLAGHPEWLITQPTSKYIVAVSDFLVSGLATYPVLMDGIVHRAMNGLLESTLAALFGVSFRTAVSDAPVREIARGVADHLLSEPKIHLSLEQQKSLSIGH